MDYKIVDIQDNGSGKLTVTVRYYTGAVTTEDEFNKETDSMEPVTRYRRTKLLEEVTYELSDPRERMSQNLIKFLNKELKTKADKQNKSVISEQTDVLGAEKILKIVTGKQITRM